VVGSQTFYDAKSFNADIGAWNTAAVTAMSRVCAASNRAQRSAGAALCEAAQNYMRL
jgi:surface protein